MYYETSIVRMAGKRITRMGDFMYGRTSQNPYTRSSVKPPSGTIGVSSALHRRFIGPCLACRTVEGHTDHTGLRLLVMTSIFALLVAAWLWGIVALGAHATAEQGSAAVRGGGPYERGVVSCPAPRQPEAEGRSAVGGDVCHAEPRLHVGTSRQPGRSSENTPSTHSGE